MKERKQKDFKPIWIYIAIFLGIPAIAGVILAAKNNGPVVDVSTKTLGIINIISYALAFIIFYLIYHKRIHSDIKKLDKKKIIFVLIAAIVLVAINEVLSLLLASKDVDIENQNSVIEMLKIYKYPMIIVTAIFGPMVEELVYRYSISTIIKNDIVFLIVSSIAFGLAHGIGIATPLYILIGVLLGLIYLKTDKNIASSTIAHIINNTVSIVLVLISL